MATILIAAYGSRGDIMPLADIGLRLRAAGHRVVMTSNTELVDEVAATGIEARAIDFHTDADVDDAGAMKAAMQMVKPAGMRQLGNNFLDAVGDVSADAILLTPFTELAGHPLVESLNVPSMGLRLQPLSATTAYPPSLLRPGSKGPRTNLLVGKAAAAAFDTIYSSVANGFRERLGLSRRASRSLRRDRTGDRWPILNGYSPAVLPRPDDWRTGIEVVGYWWPPNSPAWSVSTELERFLDAGAAPVFVGLGSVMLSETDRVKTERVIREAAAQAGVRAIVQSGGAGLRMNGDERVLSIGTVPHEWLFERVAAAVHSCGAGTTGAALRAGLPTVAVPSPGGGQPFWARRLHALGVCPPPIPRTELIADSLARALTSVARDASYRDRAQRIAARMTTDDGAGAVVAEVQRLLG